MACEKIAKAYRLRDTQQFTDNQLYSHGVFAKFIVGFLKANGLRERYRSHDAQRRHLERYAQRLAADIDRLAPAIDHERTPANTEYPWTDGENVFVPTQHSFEIAARLAEPDGQYFVKLIGTAIEDYSRIKLTS